VAVTFSNMTVDSPFARYKKTPEGYICLRGRVSYEASTKGSPQERCPIINIATGCQPQSGIEAHFLKKRRNVGEFSGGME